MTKVKDPTDYDKAKGVRWEDHPNYKRENAPVKVEKPKRNGGKK